MPKEKSVNPAQAERKKEKAKAIKKGKAENQSRRNERLARQNPHRLEKQLQELRALESSGGKLTQNEKTQIENLEKELKAVTKAREALGDAAPKFEAGRGRGRDEGRGGFRGGRAGGGVLGKRRRDDGSDSDEEDIPEDVRGIPMPRDTPPPIPKAVLDAWYQKRRERYAAAHPDTNSNTNGPRPSGTSANNIPLSGPDRMAGRTGGGGGAQQEQQQQGRPTVVVEAKTTYEAAPVIRDLRKEAVAFVPAAVRVKLDRSKGVGGLVEPEELDALEKAGYVRSQGSERERRGSDHKDPRAVMMEEVEDEDG